MAQTQITAPEDSSMIILPAIKVWVEAKKEWADEWVIEPYMVPVRYRLPLVPSMPDAELYYDYGRIKREDQTTIEEYPALIIEDQFVRIRETVLGADPFTRWTGVISSEADKLYGQPTSEAAEDTPIAPGRQTLTAYGLAHLVDRDALAGAWVNQGGSLTHVDRLPDFNAGSQSGGVIGNRSTTETDGVYHFSADGEQWTNLDILKYLVKYYAPEGMTVTVSGSPDLLANITTVHRLAGGTLYQAINSLTPRQRGVCWALRLEDGNSDAGTGICIHIASMLATEVIVDDDTTIEANNEEYTITFRTPQEMQAAVVHRSTAETYKTVRAEGGFIKSCFNLSLEDGTLAKGWTAAQETAYAAAPGDDDAQKDTERRADKYASVYQRFIVPADFNWTTGSGTGGEKKNASPGYSNGVLSLSTTAPVFNHGKKLLRTIPVRDDADDALLSPIAFIKDDDGTWYQADAIEHEELTPARLRVLDTCMGVEVRGRINHQLGKGSFTADTTLDPQFDYNTLVVCVAAETDTRVHAEATSATAMEGRTLTFPVPDADLWYVVPGTVVGVDAGALATYTGASLARDDTPRLKKIAAMALAFYGKERVAVRLNLIGGHYCIQPGQLLVEMVSGEERIEVGSIVSSVTVDYEKSGPVTSIETAFAELDFNALASLPGPTSPREVARTLQDHQRQIDAVNARMVNLPDRLPTVAGTGSGKAQLFKSIADESGGYTSAKLANSDGSVTGDAISLLIFDDVDYTQ